MERKTAANTLCWRWASAVGMLPVCDKRCNMLGRDEMKLTDRALLLTEHRELSRTRARTAMHYLGCISLVVWARASQSPMNGF